MKGEQMQTYIIKANVRKENAIGIFYEKEFSFCIKKLTVNEERLKLIELIRAQGYSVQNIILITTKGN